LNSIPIAAALRRIPADQYLAQRTPEYLLVGIVEKHVPPGGRLFSFAGLAKAYLRRDLLDSYTSAYANLMEDWLLCPITPDRLPDGRAEFRFRPSTVRRLRVVQMSQGERPWTVSEMRIFAGGRELPRAPQWRLHAHPNPWEVQLAFDNSYVTRWSSYQDRFSGMYLEVDFGQPQQVDMVYVDCAKDSTGLPMKLEVQDEGGAWRQEGGKPAVSVFRLPTGLRRAATAELKARGIEFLMACDNLDFAAADLQHNMGYWGIIQVAESYGYRLYHIE
jgi:hypothetical protein